jgi:transposase
MTTYYVGLDVHSKQSTFAIQNGDGKLVAQGEVATTPAGFAQLQAKHQLAPGTQVALETGTVAFFVARRLTALGLTPLVVDAHEVRLKAQRPNQKSDRRDALELCEGLRRGIYRTVVHVPPKQVATLRDTVSRRRHFVRLQCAQVNAVKGLLRGFGLGRLSRSLGTEVGWAKLLSALADSVELKAYVEQHRALWRTAGEQVATLERSLEQQRKHSFADQLRRLETIPGVGPIVASTAIAVFSDIGRFPDAKHAASYAGLVPSTYSSGDREAYGRITKRGSAELRNMLCEAAHHARRPNHPLNPYFVKLCAKRGYKMATVAVAHRLCRIMFSMLRHGSDFDVSKLGIEVGPFERKTVRTYRLKATNAVAK